MKYKKLENQAFSPTVYASALLLFIVAMLMSTGAMALNLIVMGADHVVTSTDANTGVTTTDPSVNPPVAETPLTGYRWLIEEDKTYHVPLNPDGTVKITGGVPEIDPNWRPGPDGEAGTLDDPADRNTISVNFHHSYMPVVATGNNLDAFPLACDDISLAPGDPCLDPAKNYFISVLPDEGYSIGGAPMKAGQTDVTVYVNRNPIPTTQITIFVHADIAPINAVWDLGEDGLEGFSIILEDAGGKYGASAGIQSQDAFGNPICTSYQYDDANNDGKHNPGEVFVSDPVTGEPAVDVPGAGCVTGTDGTVTIRNLAPGKYGVMTVPPNAVEILDGNGNGTGKFKSTVWTQTSTIEGKKLIDAWVKANEPAFFGEFGPPGPHVSIGYVPAGRDTPFIDESVLTPGNGGVTISGQAVNLHLSRTPETAFYSGGPFPHTTPWVGLNLGAAGLGKGIFVKRANDDGTFAIDNVPAGSYQLVVFDDNMDLLFAKNTVVVNADPVTLLADGSCNNITSCDLGDVPVFQWFARMEHYVYNDENENGKWDDGELPMIEQNVNLRWRDGTIYQAFPTDATGIAPFDEVFPFFSWLVSEVDFARFKATGATVVVDDGGAIDFSDPASTFDFVLNPQIQNNPLDPDANVYGDILSRTELGPVLSQAFQGFLGQTNVVQWGKKAYGPRENGGISGVVMYAVTRAENDPEQAAAEPWEPGIPRVTVNLYDRRGNFLMSTETDSWDDSLPSNCQYGANAGSGTDEPFVFRGVNTDCYDGLRNWNQVRPGVFDGGYAFGPIFSCADDFAGNCPSWVTVADPVNAPDVAYIRPGRYEVEVIPPNGYEVIKSQDRNVDFGDTFFPSPELLPPSCVGDAYVVPAELALFPGEPAPLAGQSLPLCDRKLVKLFGGANAAADFFLFTEVPIAGHFIGFILDDTANEFDPASPQFGEKYAPPFLPVSIRDWTGREISRTISDEYGVYNALIPSTFTENLGQPSGISPNMLTTCMNAKSKPDGFGGLVTDPLHNPQYSQFCYTFQYMPGSTTYLDTPVVPVAAFAGADQNPLDCAFVDTTPRIHSVDVTGANNPGGPYIATTRKTINGVASMRVFKNQTITINSMGDVEVPNPAYDGVGGTENKTIFRDYGFGSEMGTLELDGVPLSNITWGNDVITATMTDLAAITGKPSGRQLKVTRASGSASITGVTVQVGLRGTTHGRPTNPNPNNGNPGVKVISVPADYATIQEAIDIAGARDLILVAPGIYNEMVIMWKPVQLQGWGEGSVTIDAIKTPFEKLAEWRRKIEELDDGGFINRAPGQEAGFGGIEPIAFFSEEGAGVLVVAPSGGLNRYNLGRNKDARIDGFTITGADTGGGVVLNAYVDFMDVSNNNIVNNSAFFAGGVRVGHPLLTFERLLSNGSSRLEYSDANNDFDRIHHNTITQNGGLTGAGGGIGLHTGSSSYQVTDNFVCGNFTTASGAGVAHYGFSDKGLIKGNTVLFNENFNQGIVVNGGGILVAGLPAFGCPIDPITGLQTPACLRNTRSRLSPGAGSVKIDSNLVQGNSAGVGDGAGIRLARINGLDVQPATATKPVRWKYTVDVVNNMIVDNVAGLAGGGISVQDALDVNIIQNTIANNDSTATSGEAFAPGLPDITTAQPGAGIIIREHSADLQWRLKVANATFTASDLVNNIVWHNRQFFWMSDTSVSPPANGLCPDIGGSLGLTCVGGNAPVYDDLAVGSLLCTDCIVSGGTDPAFLAEYVNGSRNTTNVINEGTTSMQAPPAFDEGGNFIRLRYGPLTQTDTDTGLLFGDYHISGATTPQGFYANVPLDFDGQARNTNPFLRAVDIGADEVNP